MIRNRLRPRILSLLLLLGFVAASYFSVLASAAVVTLDSIEIFKTHEWFASKPRVYFLCKEGNRTFLPDVKEKGVFYAFKGQESWQPLMELHDKKCKRCGFYEQDDFKSDDVFDEWEFCVSDFTRSDGKYIHYKEKELNATFLCPECVPLGGSSDHSSKPGNVSNNGHWVLITLVCVLVFSVVVLGSVIAYKYWKKRKQQQDHARFLKMFEEGDDDMEDELGIGPLSHVV